MALTQLAPPYPVFTGRDGKPLDSGFLYFGKAGLNPETHPVPVYYDINKTLPVAQPVRTMHGYPMRQGSPTLIYADEDYSVTVRDKSGSLVIYSPTGYGIAPGSAGAGGSSRTHDNFSGDGVTTEYTLSSAVLSHAASDVYIDGVYQSKEGYTITGGALTFTTAPPAYSEIEVVASGVNNVGGVHSENVTFSPGHVGATNRTAQSKMRDIPSVLDFGAAGDGVTDDAAAFNAAWAACAPQAVLVPAGTYSISGTVSGKFYSFGAVTVIGGTVDAITNLVP